MGNKLKILKLKEYAEDLGFKVNLNAKSSSLLTKKGTLNTPYKLNIVNQNPTQQYYHLLHELGHWELLKDWKVYKEKYPFIALGEEFALKNIYKYRKRVAYKVDIMKEEIDAWEEGKNLALKMGFDLDIYHYKKYSTSFLFMYIKHLGKRS